MKKKTVVKLITLCLCGALTITSAASLVSANGAAENESTLTATGAPESTEAATIAEILNGYVTAPDNANASESKNTEKDETVYVLAGADGSSQKIIVSDWLKNPSGATSIKDLTSLTEVENVKGDEACTWSEDGITWSSQGKDVYYQGTSSKELPVSVKVTYLLDGKEIMPEALKGKSGHVTIRYTYENHQQETVLIGGNKEQISVPFAMLTGVLLDGEAFTNVEVIGGKLFNDGDRNIVVGLAFPGLQENLNLDAEKFTIPDSLEIQADVQNFSIGTAVTVATNELFNKLDMEKFDSISDLQNAMGQLTDGMTQLLDGSGQLTDGLSQLLEKSGELVNGVDQLASGAKELQMGTASLDGGAADLAAGASKLSSGLSTIASNNDSLNGGARQVFETLLATARTQLLSAGLTVPEMTIENYGTVLNGVIASLDENAVYATALQTVTDAVNAKRDYIQQQVTAAVTAEVENGVKAAVQSQVTAQVTSAVQSEVASKVTSTIRQNVFAQVVQTATGMDVETYQGAVTAGMISEENQNAILAAVDAKMASEEIQAMISAKTEEQVSSEEVKGMITQTTEAKMASEEISSLISSNVTAKLAEDSIQQLIAQNTEIQVQKAITDTMAGEEVQGKLAAASAGAKAVIDLKSSLDSYNTFYGGIQSYTAGVAQAAAGAGQLAAGTQALKDGTAKLSAGATQLSDGMTTLQASLPALVDGITQLCDGSAALKDGLQKFDEEGIQKLTGAVNGDLEALSERAKATIHASKHYNNFSGISDDMSGQVKFIYRIAGIE